MKGPNYGAVTGVTAALALVCGIRSVLIDSIPPPNPKLAYAGRGEFVSQAFREPIEWRTDIGAAIVDSRQLSRPLLLVIGVAWSKVGREASQAMSQPEVARAVNRGFIPVRVDASLDPRWISAFLPLSRTHVGFSTGFQAWVLDPRGRLVDFIGRVGAYEVLDDKAMLAALVRARQRFADSLTDPAVPPLEQNQREDIARLMSPGVAAVDPPAAATTLAGRLDRKYGGWDAGGLTSTRPLALRFLQMTGHGEETYRSLRNTIFTPRYDWIDGGIYRSLHIDGLVPEFDKSTVQNAQFGEALAVQSVLSDDPQLATLAHGTLRWVLSHQHDGLVPAAEIGDEDDWDRSARASFSPARMRGRLEGDTVSRAERLLGLDGSSGRAYVPCPRRPEYLEAPDFGRVLQGIAAKAGPPRMVAGYGLADVNGTVAASLLRSARILGDADLAARAGDLVDQLDRFRRFEDIQHSIDTLPNGAFVGDYLSFADASLEDFLTNGRVPSLVRGLRVLQRTFGIFLDPESGQLRPVVGDSNKLFPAGASLPQVTDDERESVLAEALRLADSYASVVGTKGAGLRKIANDLAPTLSAVVDVEPAMGGALCALTRHADPRSIFVVGPNAVTRAFQLARRYPNRLVVPAVGIARPELEMRKPGLYLETANSVAGPMSPDTIEKRLAPTVVGP